MGRVRSVWACLPGSAFAHHHAPRRHARGRRTAFAFARGAPLPVSRPRQKTRRGNHKQRPQTTPTPNKLYSYYGSDDASYYEEYGYYADDAFGYDEYYDDFDAGGSGKKGGKGNGGKGGAGGKGKNGSSKAGGGKDGGGGGGVKPAGPQDCVVVDGKPKLSNGTAPCDVKFSGVDKHADLLKGGLDGVYKLKGCHNGRPLYVRDKSPPGEARVLWYSTGFGDWDVSNGTEPNEAEILLYGGDTRHAAAPLFVEGWHLGADLKSDSDMGESVLFFDLSGRM